ncbi:MAG: DUF389 domain-containing protein [Bacteroidota bacterium]|nr:DUF389 domain-containing protein [Bacteroidota bacterium]
MNENSEIEEKQSPRPMPLLRIWVDLRRFVRETMDLHWEAQVDGTGEIIRKDMIFRGHVVWVLVCSIFIASIGLNTNSPAVIIGAMLISPLMGPILAIGLSLGTNDMLLLRRALKNFAVMVIVALVTSTLYFLITPISDLQTEILARTRPTLLDAMIAIFGGIAGIIGVSRRNRGNVIPGVAIATALMPPLCTAGYGLATFQWQFFFGAIYLFVLNSIFIAIATFTIIRLLHFPMAKEMNPKRAKRVRWVMTIFIVLLLTPSAYMLYNVAQEEVFRKRVTEFIKTTFPYRGAELLEQKPYIAGAQRSIELFLFGDRLSEKDVDDLQREMARHGLESVKLVLHQTGSIGMPMGDITREVRSGIVEDLFDRNDERLREKDDRIRDLEKQLDRVPMLSLVSELQALYPNVSRISYANAIEWDGEKLDTVPVIHVAWEKKGRTRNTPDPATIEPWLQQRLGKKDLRVRVEEGRRK